MTDWLKLLPVLVFGFFTLCSVARAETTTHKITHDGKERTYLLTVPKASDDKPRSLVMALHFYPGSGEALQQLTGFSAVAEREGFLVAYPDGLNGGFNALMCCGSEDDVGFIRAVIDKLTRDHKIDPDRIYATGISNGGDLTYRLAAELPGVFAGIAPVSGGMTGDWIQKKTGNLPTRPVSLITFIGERDRYAGAFMAGVKFWREALKCEVEDSPVAGTDLSLSQGTCADKSAVAIYSMPQMGHAWPGGDSKAGLAYTPSPINATELIWAFFREHPRK
jgi:poly(3-hydroxybutyrate) depolymerase